MKPIPELQTERLVLRAWRLSDFGVLADFWADSELNRWRGGAMSRASAWDKFSAMSGEWMLRGYGTFAAVNTSNGLLMGYAGLWHPIDLDEPELCWSLFGAFHGRGYATEAAARVLDWAGADLGLRPLMSFIHPENRASISVAERLGAKLERRTMLRGEQRLFYRHRDTRRPGKMGKVVAA